MSTRFLVNPQVPFGQMIVELVDKIAEAQALMTRVKGACDSMTYGTPSDYASLETELGLPVGQGEDFFYLLSLAKDKLNDSILVELVNKADQG